MYMPDDGYDRDSGMSKQNGWAMICREYSPFMLRMRLCTAWIICAVLSVSVAHAETFTINTVGGPVQIDVGHIGPSGSLTSPSDPEPSGFRPPTIFSAPLPSGSGARALGLGGAFTAVADDATAASWNPAGLIQLERSEASVVLRARQEVNDHYSSSEFYRVGRNEFDGQAVNYISLVCPFQVGLRNYVFSSNYQEAYDFTQEFTADLSDIASSRSSETSFATYSERIVKNYQTPSTIGPPGTIDIDVTSDFTSTMQSVLTQLVSSESLTALDFRQEGSIEAITQALAVEVTPRLSIGAAFNIYRGGAVRSRATAHYGGSSGSNISITDDRSTTGTYAYDGWIHLPPGGGVPIPINIPIGGSGSYPVFTDTSTRRESPGMEFEGVYEEVNEYDELNGFNGTFGVLYAASRHLSLGFSMDLPWTAEGTQTKTVRNTITTYNESKSTILNVSKSEQVQGKDVSYHFPLYWAAGSVWRWNNRFSTTLDISQVLWSDFTFQAGDEPEINPLDGSPHGENEVDDCWSARVGAEYLWVLRATEVPFRAGLSWEQRPAIGEPDQYYGVSLGSGLSFGKDPGKTIIDVAYIGTWGDDVLGSLVPGQEGLETDVMKHEIYISSIVHF